MSSPADRGVSFGELQLTSQLWQQQIRVGVGGSFNAVFLVESIPPFRVAVANGLFPRQSLRTGARDGRRRRENRGEPDAVQGAVSRRDAALRNRGDAAGHCVDANGGREGNAQRGSDASRFDRT